MDGRLGRIGGWGGREYGAEGSMGRKGVCQHWKLVWGGKEYGALRLGTPRHTNLHFDPQATTFLSPPGGIYLISPGGPNLVKFPNLKPQISGAFSYTASHRRDAGHPPPESWR